MEKFDVHQYKSFIYDLPTIKEFFETIMVPLENDEVFYMICQARKKYSDKIIKNPIVKRDLLESNDFERFTSKIQEFSIILPLRKDVEMTLDRDISVIYIDINPKSMFKAYKEFKEKVDDQLEHYYLYKNVSIELFARKLRSHFLSAIARSIGPRKIYSLFDLDTQDTEKFQSLIDYIKGKNLAHTVKWISKTKNGYHFIIQADKKEKSSLLEPFFRNKSDLELPELEIKDKGDTRTPICGTYQGGTPVENISLDILK